MTQGWLFDGEERNLLQYGVPELGLDSFLKITLSAYLPVLMEVFNKESAIVRFFREMQGPQQAELLNVAWPTSCKKWFRTRSGRWQYAFIGIDEREKGA